MPTLDRSVLVDVSADTALAVIADIEAYPEFLPGCESTAILEQSESLTRAMITVAAMGVHESFTTSNVRSDFSLTVELEDGPFEYLRGEWSCKPLSHSGCRVSLTLSYKPKGVIALVLSGAAPVAADKMVTAFVSRMRKMA